MSHLDAPGLRADWLNAWLAAIGAAVLVDGLRLHWSDDPLAHAAFSYPGQQPINTLIAGAMPTIDEVGGLAIANHRGSDTSFPRTPTRGQYHQRVALARRNGDASLTSSVTDLDDSDHDAIAHSPFDPPASRGKTLWDRVSSCVEALGNPEAMVSATLTGTSRRIKANGLGFDHRRLLSPADPIGHVWVDPVVEVLAFVGLTLLPSRGDGHRATFRGWTDRPTRTGAFTWPTWAPPLEVAAIDALLDRHWSPHAVPVQGATATFESVPYAPRGAMDQTRGYASRRVT